jgi:hypothetical protein
MKLTGAAILASRGMQVLQATPVAYSYRSKPRPLGDLSAANDGVFHREPGVIRTVERTLAFAAR